MVGRRVLVVLLGAGLFLVIEQDRGILLMLLRFSCQHPVMRTGQVFRDRMKNGTNVPEMVVIPAGRFRMGDIQGKGRKDKNRCTRCIFGDPSR